MTLRFPSEKDFEYGPSQLTPRGERLSRSPLPAPEPLFRTREEALAYAQRIAPAIAPMVDVTQSVAAALAEFAAQVTAAFAPLNSALAAILARNPPRHVRRRVNKQRALVRHYERQLARIAQSAQHRGVPHE